jgi:hypothetical protein
MRVRNNVNLTQQNIVGGSSFMHNTLSMTHSKTHSKDSSGVLNPASIYQLRMNEANEDEDKRIMDNQCSILLFNHRVILR